MFQNFTADNQSKKIIHSIGDLISEAGYLGARTAHEININATQEADDECPEDDQLEIVAFIFLPFFIVGLFSNGTIFWFLCCRIKRTEYTVYVLNLAIADFTVLFCYITYFAIHFFIWEDFDLDKPYYHVLYMLTFLGFNTSFFLLTAISVERYVGVFFPLCYRFNRPKQLSAILCASVWVLSCIVAGIEYICWSKIGSTAVKFTNVFLLITFTLLLPTMVFCSFSLFIKISKHSQPKPPGQFYCAILITVILFLIFNVPENIIYLIKCVNPEIEVSCAIINCFFSLTLINSCINPFVYFFVGRWKHHQSNISLYATINRSCNVENLEHLSHEQAA